MTIYLMAPDRNEITGGVRIMYGIARALRESGRAAVVWQSASMPHPEALAVDVLELVPGDSLWAVEVAPPETRQALTEIPTVVLNQGHYFTLGIHDGYQHLDAPYPGWKNVSAVVGTSTAIIDHLHAIQVSCPIHYLPLYVDGHFHASETLPSERPRRVTFMPRRRTSELLSLVNAARRDRSLAHWAFDAIDGVPSETVAKLMGQSAIFLHGAMQEGFGLPGLEAMASGCYVAGFPGDGGREFMTDSRASLLTEGNLAEATRQFLDLLHRFDSEPTLFDDRARQAQRFIRGNYSWPAFQNRVAEIADSLAEASSVKKSTKITHTTCLARQQARLPLRKRLGMIRRALSF